MRHSRSLLRKIVKLRKEGKSIIAIMQTLSLAKTTVWHHVHKIPLTDDQKVILRSNQGAGRVRREKAEAKALVKANNLLASKFREKAVIIAMLYWAEGHKKNCCAFTNTGENMIKIYLRIIREILLIEEKRIEITIRIFEGMNKVQCLKYWAKVTSKAKSKIKVRINDGGSRGRTKFGICRVLILQGSNELKLMHALIRQISKSMLNLANLPS